MPIQLRHETQIDKVRLVICFIGRGAGCDAFEEKPTDLPRILGRIKELTGG